MKLHYVAIRFAFRHTCLAIALRRQVTGKQKTFTALRPQRLSGESIR